MAPVKGHTEGREASERGEPNFSATGALSEPDRGPEGPSIILVVFLYECDSHTAAQGSQSSALGSEAGSPKVHGIRESLAKQIDVTGSIVLASKGSVGLGKDWT
jgi:hypothetical protein